MSGCLGNTKSCDQSGRQAKRRPVGRLPNVANSHLLIIAKTAFPQELKFQSVIVLQKIVV